MTNLTIGVFTTVTPVTDEDFILKTFFPVRIQTMFTLKFLSGWTAPGPQTYRLVVAIRDLAQIRVEAEQ